MKAYYEIRNIQWNPIQFRQNWEAFENFDIYLNTTRVGVLRFSYAPSNCYIRDFQIEAKAQGKGIGKHCLDYAIRLAKNRGDHFIKLRVFSENPAVSLYQQHGFKKISEFNGLIEMSLSL